jgi:hypothetical protein
MPSHPTWKTSIPRDIVHTGPILLVPLRSAGLAHGCVLGDHGGRAPRFATVEIIEIRPAHQNRGTAFSVPPACASILGIQRNSENCRLSPRTIAPLGVWCVRNSKDSLSVGGVVEFLTTVIALRLLPNLLPLPAKTCPKRDESRATKLDHLIEI